MKFEQLEQRDDENLWAYACHLRDTINRAFAVPSHLLRPSPYDAAYWREIYRMQRELEHLIMTHTLPLH